MISDISLSVQFRVAPKMLEIEYLVTNESNGDIYLVDLAAQLGTKGISIRPATIEVALDPTEKLILSSRLLPISSNVLYPVAPDIYTSPLRPSEIKKSMFSVILPIKLANEQEVKPETSIIPQVKPSLSQLSNKPRTVPAAPTGRTINVSKVIFILGVISKSPKLKMEEKNIDGLIVTRIEAGEAIHHQEELKIEAIVSPSVPLIIGEV